MTFTKATLFFLTLTTAVAANANWTYRKSADEMTGKSKEFATIKSKNSLDLNFPYKGKNFGEIILRRHQDNGESIIISIDKGQIICFETPCSIQMRFDDEAPISFNAVASSDFDQTVIFLWDKEKFITAANGAKQILVKLPLFQNGESILKFNSIKPLVWTYIK